MSIAAKVAMVLELAGDGASTTFTFDLDTLYGAYFPAPPCSSGPFVPISQTTIPNSISVSSVSNTDCTGTGITGTASISRRTVTLTFSAALSGTVLVLLVMQFNG